MYANGTIPLSKLVHLGANFYLPPGTAARWKWLVDAARDKYGVTLRITPDRSGLGGWNAYRPLFAQEAYKEALGNLAAYPGTSSHGGVYNGREAFAVDVDNWEDLGWSRFKSLCRLAGFTVDFVSPQERWHIGDLTGTGWVVPANLYPPKINRETTRIKPKEEPDMKYGQLHTTRPDGKMLRRALYAPGTAYFVYWDSNDAKLANALAKQFETGDSQEVSYGVFEAFQKAAANVGGTS